jgi:uncharacterized protein (DUF2237 family)
MVQLSGARKLSDVGVSSNGNCLCGHMDLGLQQGMFTQGFLVFGKDQPSDLFAAHSDIQLQTDNGYQQVKEGQNASSNRVQDRIRRVLFQDQ